MSLVQQIRAVEPFRDLLQMTTKRRAESSLLHDASPEQQQQQKKRCRSVCDADAEAVHAVYNVATAAPALFSTLTGERRRKRPRCCEDQEEHRHRDTPAAPRHGDGTATHAVDTGDARASGNFHSASGACEVASKGSASGSTLETRPKVTRFDNNGDELSAFNSFQFWRTPLPALDLSLLDSPSTLALEEDSSVRDTTEEMET